MHPVAVSPGCRLRQTATADLRPSRYERVSAALASLLMLGGAATLLMFLIWLSRAAEPPHRVPARISLPGQGPQDQSEPSRGERWEQFQPPGEAELADAQQPPPELALEAIPSFVESQMLAFNSLEVGRGAGSSSGGRGNLGGGPSGGEPIVGIEPWDRWELRFTTSNLEEYKQQLDYFGIELGVAGGGQPVVDYVKGFSGSRPSVRVGSPRGEKRIRFLYADGPLKRADRELVRAAGVEVAGRVVFHFYSDEMYQSLLQLENDRMQPRRISEVIRTVFGVRRAGAGFEFFIIRQDYRHGGGKATRVAPQGPAT